MGFSGIRCRLRMFTSRARNNNLRSLHRDLPASVADLGINLSRISSIFNRSSHPNEQYQGFESNSSAESSYWWAKRQPSDYRLQKLNVKAAENRMGFMRCRFILGHQIHKVRPFTSSRDRDML